MAYSQKTSAQTNLSILSEAETKLLNKLLEREGIPTQVRQAIIVPADRQKDLPLSFAQQRLWFIDQLEPGSSAYNVPTAVRLRGALNVEALQKSLNHICQRHEVLRTCFPQRLGLPTQQILPPTAVNLPQMDLASLPTSEALEKALLLAQEETRRPFDLSTGPLLRALLLSLADDDHILVLTLHHIVSDGWSVAILIREFSHLYSAYQAGKEPDLPPLNLQYADFAVWQRNWLSGAVLEQQLSYWREQLGELQDLDLPTDKPRPARPTHQGQRLHFFWSKDFTNDLKGLARDQGVTLFMVLLAGFQVLLSRYSGQSEIAIGTDVANRNRSEIEGLMGFFINQLVLRCHVGGRQSFVEFLEQVREVTLGAYEHQDLPFERLVDELSPHRDMSRSPLFQVKLVLHNTRQEALQMAALQLESFPLESRQIKLDINLMMEEFEGQLLGALNYASDLFAPDTAQALVEHLEVLLRAAVANPNQQLSELPLLTDSQRRHLLEQHNQTQFDYGQARCIHEMFEQQVKLRPQVRAVSFEDQHLTYEELNQRANQVAHYLQDLGVGPEVRVALCLSRGVDLLVGLLGVLKAGGAYVPMEISFPSQRLGEMLEDGVAVVLTEEAFLGQLPAHWAQTVCIDRDWSEIATCSSDNPSSQVTPESLLYVIYTSGSSGKPKGVGVEHRQMFHYVNSITRRLGLDDSMKLGLVSSIATDLGHTMLYPALCLGAQLHLLSEERISDGRALSDYNRKHSIDALKMTPTHVAALSQSESSPWLVPERRLVLGGEACRWEWLRELAARHPDCLIFNHYGPTETTVGVVSTQLTGQSRAADEPGNVPLGTGLDNVELYVVDGGGELLPEGLPGELYIGGKGVSRGYVNQARLTAERFVPDAFSNQPGGRLYRSGDRVRWNERGELEFLGRVDQQIKIRGHRVELGEIEASLSECRGISQSAVLLEGEGLEALLVAYVTLAGGQKMLDWQSLQQELSQRLPSHMVPSRFVELEEMPLLGNGKIDRKALQEMGSSWQVRGEYKAARNPLEEVLCGIWEQVLEVERVGIEENFFELGGHSLLATQVISRIRDVLRVELPLRILFDSPSVDKLALAIPEHEEVPGQAEIIAAMLKKVKQMSAENLTDEISTEDR